LVFREISDMALILKVYNHHLEQTWWDELKIVFVLSAKRD
jgi:hypothetical protein